MQCVLGAKNSQRIRRWINRREHHHLTHMTQLALRNFDSLHWKSAGLTNLVFNFTKSDVIHCESRNPLMYKKCYTLANSQNKKNVKADIKKRIRHLCGHLQPLFWLKEEPTHTQNCRYLIRTMHVRILRHCLSLPKFSLSCRSNIWMLVPNFLTALLSFRLPGTFKQ